MTVPPRRLGLWLAGAATALFLLPLLTLQFIPDQVVEQAVQRLLAGHGITLQARRFQITFPAGIRMEGLTLGDGADTLLRAEQCAIRLRLLPLCIGRVSCSLSARIGAGGRLMGDLTLHPRLQGDIQLHNLDLADLPILTSALGSGIHGATSLHCTLADSPSTGLTGRLRLQVHNLRLQSVRISSLPLPDATFPLVRGLITLKGRTLSLTSLALQGDGIYLRLSGAASLAPAAPLNLTLEIMPDAQLLNRQQSVFLLLFPFQTSPGSYRLPIGGTLAHPQIAGR